MFDQQRFIQDCIHAVPEGQAAIREIVARAVSDPAAVMAGLGEPEHAGITALHNAPDLTIIKFVWAPCMSLMPHDHQMFSVVGIYAGREDNIFWRRSPAGIEAASARSLGAGDIAALGQDTIHSVVNPIGKMTCAIHVYGGDFFHPMRPRHQWDPETLTEGPWNFETAKTLFREAEARFNAVTRAS
ncbi:hypothetical protein GSY71_01125 [Pusillimonas sp. TS35]|uniref:hypothetical protein n=1 Tax=Paracandidimonas lactea TaxID=2895524 RepID=UPI00136B419D|nr:hypothetical protein [Paracandidimonas lactea]MYN11757.1 hypothetical protein [Pusillimonas sp. TS35]